MAMRTVSFGPIQLPARANYVLSEVDPLSDNPQMIGSDTRPVTTLVVNYQSTGNRPVSHLPSDSVRQPGRWPNRMETTITIRPSIGGPLPAAFTLSDLRPEAVLERHSTPGLS